MIITMKMALIAGVAILAIAGITVGIVFGTMGDDCTEFGAPVDLKFEQRDDKLFLLWGSPDNLGDCEAKYKVLLTVNDEEAEPVEVNKGEYEIPEVAPCDKIYAAVSTVDEDNNESEKTVKEITIDVGEVSEINIQNLKNEASTNGFTITWEKPTGYDSCQILYKISQDGEVKEEAYESNSYEILTENLHLCDNKIEVTPIIQSKPGKSTETIIVQDVGDISAITVTDFTQSASGTSWTLKWKRPENFENCQIKYQVYINYSPNPLETAEETITIEDEILEKCAINDLSIVPKIQNKIGSSALVQIKGDVNDVSKITVGEITSSFKDNLWTIKWEKPEKYKACLITYQLYLGENPLEITGQDGPSFDEEISFPNDPLKKCGDNEIGVLPTIEEKEGLIKYTTVKGDVGEVSTVTVGTLTHQLDGVMWTLTWTKPVDYEDCKITYSVYLEDEQIQENIEELSTTIENAGLKKCQDNKVSVVPVIETKLGEKLTENIIGDVGDVSKITVGEITPTLADNSWSIKWEKPPTYEDCSVTYQAFFGDEELPVSNEDTTISNDRLKKCENNEISITPIIETKAGESKSTIIKGDVGDLSQVTLGTIETNLENNVWSLKWIKPTGYDKCTIKYMLYLGENPEGKEVLTETTIIDNFSLQKCVDNLISIVPVIDSKEGPKASVNIKGDVGDVSKITVGEITTLLKDNIWTLKWEKPPTFEDCSITYQIYLGTNPQDSPISALETTISNDDLTKCESIDIGVTPIIETKTGENKITTIKGDVGDLSQVNLGTIETNLENNVWSLKWTKPAGYDKCTIKYKLYLGENPQDEEILVETTTIENSLLQKCVDNLISVAPVIDVKEGPKTSVNIKGDVGDVSKITVGEITTSLKDNIWTIKWEKPSTFEDCSITYQIYLGTNPQNSPISALETTISNDDLTKCENIDVGVTPIIETKTGENKITTIKGDVGDLSNVNLGTIQSNLANNIWTLQWTKPTGYDKCTIKYKLYLGENPQDEEILAKTTTISNDLLTKCIDNEINISPIIENKEGVKTSTKIKGDIGDFSKISVGTINPTLDGNNWKLDWQIPTGFEECTIKYKLYLGDQQQGGDISGITTTISNDLLKKCVKNEISVIPEIESTQGLKSSIEIEGDLGNIEAITVNDLKSTYESGDWKIEWSMDQMYENCQKSYILLIKDVAEPATTDTTKVIENSKFDICTENRIAVQVEINGELGGESAIQIFGEPPIENRITEISLQIETGDLVKASWKKADEYENCQFKYNLEIKKGQETIKQVSDLNEESFEETLTGITNCENVSASVIAQYTNTNGQPMVFSECKNVVAP